MVLMTYHFYNMTEEDKEYRQGRSREKVRQTEIVAGISIIICLIIIGLLALCDAYIHEI